MAAVGADKKGMRVFQGFNAFLMLLICISMLYPFMNLLAISLSGKFPVLRGEVGIIPKEFSFQAYLKVMQSESLWLSYCNTIKVTVMGTFGSVIVVALAAYPISKKRLIFRKFFTFFIMLTLWFQAGMIPTFLVVKNLGLIDSHAALILVPLLSAYHVIIMRTFFENVPAELEESATIDGANDIQILTKIYMPLSKPVIATISLWVAVGLWNAFLEPLLYLNDSKKYTLQLVLREIVIANTGFNLGIDTGTDHGDEFEVVAESVKYATVIIATVPILMIYPFVQKYFVKGVMIGAVKG